MCDPATMTGLSIAGSLIGTAFSAVGQMQQGKAQAAQANYQAAVGRNNAILAQRAADDARLRGEEAARRVKTNASQLLGKQRAMLAANGVLVDSGSALDLTTDTAGISKLDELTVRSNAEREALGYQAQGMNFQAGSELQGMSAQNSLAAGTSAAAGTLLTGAGSVASKWYQFDKQSSSTPKIASGWGSDMGAFS